MFPLERQNRIKEILAEKKQTDISTLSSMLNVTEVTIRRDLEKLESEGYLKRTHGGAVLTESEAEQLPRLINYDKETSDSLTMLATLAAFFINDNDTVFLGPGMANHFFHHALKDKRNVTIVTNDLTTTFCIAKQAPETKIICPSGELNNGELQLYGRISESILNNMFFNIAFLDIDGVTLEKGYSVSSLDKSYLLNDIMKSADQSIAICDYTKFGRNSFVPLGKLDLFDTVISNEKTPIEYKEHFFHNNVKFFCTFDAYRGG